MNEEIHKRNKNRIENFDEHEKIKKEGPYDDFDSEDDEIDERDYSSDSEDDFDSEDDENDYSSESEDEDDHDDENEFLKKVHSSDSNLNNLKEKIIEMLKTEP